MKAVVMTGANKPWEVQEVPTPTAEPGQVLVKVHASGMSLTPRAEQRKTPGQKPSDPGFLRSPLSDSNRRPTHYKCVALAS